MHRINVLKYFWSIIVHQLILVLLFVGSMAVLKDSGDNRMRLPVKEVVLPLRVERDPEPPVARLDDAAQPVHAELTAQATPLNSPTACEAKMETAMRTVDHVVQYFWGDERQALEALFGGPNVKPQWNAVKKECWKGLHQALALSSASLLH